MKIKSGANHQSFWFNFSFNLLEDNYLEKVLALHHVEELYLCFYGLPAGISFEGFDTSQISKQLVRSSSKKWKDVVLKTKANQLSAIFSIVKGNVDELTVWSCDVDWEIFIKECLQTTNFFACLKQNEKKEAPFFYLSLNCCEGYAVDIICDAEQCHKVTENDLIAALSK